MVQDQTLLDISSITRLAPGESPNPQPFEQRDKNLAISCSSPLGARTIPASCPASPRLSLTPSSAKPQQYSDSSPVSPGINATSFYTFCPHTAQNIQASASDRTLTPTRKSTRPPATMTPEDSSQSPGYSKTGLKNTGKGFESDLEDPDHERYVSRPYTRLSPQMAQLGIGSLRAPDKKKIKYLLWFRYSHCLFSSNYPVLPLNLLSKKQNTIFSIHSFSSPDLITNHPWARLSTSAPPTEHSFKVPHFLPNEKAHLSLY